MTMMNESASPIARTEWWLASLGRTLVWARLRVREAGIGEVFDSDGNTLVYDSEDSARAALRARISPRPAVPRPSSPLWPRTGSATTAAGRPGC